MSGWWVVLVWSIYFAGIFAHTFWITVLCIAFGLLNMMLGLA